MKGWPIVPDGPFSIDRDAANSQRAGENLTGAIPPTGVPAVPRQFPDEIPD